VRWLLVAPASRRRGWIGISSALLQSQKAAAGRRRHLCACAYGAIDTVYVRTYTVYMNITLSVDEQVVARARAKAEALGKSLNQVIRDYLQKLAGGDDPERSIEEFNRLSGQGDSRGWKFNRDEIHDRS
jgi:hypothetical protein